MKIVFSPGAEKGDFMVITNNQADLPVNLTDYNKLSIFIIKENFFSVSDYTHAAQSTD